MKIEIDVKDIYLNNFLEIIKGLENVMVNNYLIKDEESKIIEELKNKIPLIKSGELKTRPIEELLNEL